MAHLFFRAFSNEVALSIFKCPKSFANNNNSLELNDAERSSVQDNTLQANFTTIADETESAGRLREKANLIEQTYP